MTVYHEGKKMDYIDCGPFPVNESIVGGAPWHQGEDSLVPTTQGSPLVKRVESLSIFGEAISQWKGRKGIQLVLICFRTRGA